MKTIFISGSRNIIEINELVKSEILFFISNNYKIILGDADGVDKLVQDFLFKHGYLNIEVYAIGGNTRNNIGYWNVKTVLNGNNINKYNFYQEKDKRMTKDCDIGLVIWDLESKGSLNNIKELLLQNKQLYLYINGLIYKDINSYEKVKIIKKNGRQIINQPSLFL